MKEAWETGGTGCGGFGESTLFLQLSHPFINHVFKGCFLCHTLCWALKVPGVETGD